MKRIFKEIEVKKEGKGKGKKVTPKPTDRELEQQVRRDEV